VKTAYLLVLSLVSTVMAQQSPAGSAAADANSPRIFIAAAEIAARIVDADAQYTRSAHPGADAKARELFGLRDEN
jgi:hypothetical protein